MARKTEISAKVRAAVWERSEGYCEMKVPGVCINRAAEIDHIKKRSQGGMGTLDNLQHGCKPCHDWKEANPNAGHELGLYKRAWE